MTTNRENSEVVLDWDKLMREINGETDDTYVNTEQDFSAFDQWLSQEHTLNNSAEIESGVCKDQSQLLSPPLYAGFSNVTRTDDLEQPRAEGLNAVAELKARIQALQIELEDRTRKLDWLHVYVEELQPWTHEISGLVDKLVTQHAMPTSFCEACSHHVSLTPQGSTEG